MKVTRHNPTDAPDTLHMARYCIEFDRPDAARAVRQAVRVQPLGSSLFVVSAMDMYKTAEVSAVFGDVVPAQVLDEVMELRGTSACGIQVRETYIDSTLYPFQYDGACFLTMSRDALLADEMGLGKTVQALMALPEQAFGIIVAPKSLVYTWVREAAIWRPDLQFTAVDREGLRGVAAGEFIVATPDAVRIHHARNGIAYNDEPTLEGSFVILDEAHLYKNPDAQRTESIRRLVTHFDVRWALTGTPLSNKPPDLWGTLHSIGLASKMFGDRQAFDDIFGGVKDRHGEYSWPVRPKDPVGLRNAFRGRSLRRLRKDVAPEIPEKTYSVIDHVSPPDCTGEERACIRRFKEGSLDEKFGEPVAAVQRKLAESKIDVMYSTVDRFVESGDPLVVFSANVAPLEALAHKYGCPLVVGSTSMVDRDRAVADFQDGHATLIGLQVQAGGVGITLTAAHHMLFVQRDWRVDVNTQAEDRICRIGQTRTCVIYDILSDHPLDQIIRGVLRSKARMMAATTAEIPAQDSHDGQLRTTASHR